MDVANEILDAIEIIVDKKIRENTAQIYPGICKSVSGNSCVMSINGKDNTIQFYGSIPTVGAIYRVFVPDGNMSMAFAITGNDDRKGLHYSNPNLLDNWYFGNPVDQRQGRIVVPNTTYYSDNQLTTSAGTTSAYVTAYRYATGTANGVNYASFKLTDSDTAPTYYAAPENVVRGYTGARYWIDRWEFVNIGTVLIKDGYIQVTQDWGINQLFPALPTGTYTVSVLIRKSTAPRLKLSISGVADLWFTDYESEYAKGDSWTLISKTFNGAPASVSIDSAGVTSTFELYAAKLELGSQQTLAHQENGVWVLNEIPDYGEQLARCQRYFYRVTAPYVSDYSTVGNGFFTKNFADIIVPIPKQMRNKPTVTISNMSDLRLQTSSNEVVPTAISVVNMSSAAITLRTNCTGLTDGAAVIAYLRNKGYIDFTSDL